MNIIDRFRLKDKKAFITGGARGIGKSIAISFAQAGADVAIVDVEFDEAKKTVEELEHYGIMSIAIKADVTKPEEVGYMVRR